MDKDGQYFFKMSGTIKSSKQKEFQQSVRLIFKLLPSGCLGYNLALDMDNVGLYHLFFLWSSEDSFTSFKKSSEYEVLLGAFKILGSYEDTMWGKKSDMQLFELNFLDTNLMQP